jgi:hypothetical protein
VGYLNSACLGDALLSDTVQLEDVLWGLYHFLDAHPTETIIASLKVDHGDANDSAMQRTLHDHFTTSDTRDYWVQSQSVSSSCVSWLSRLKGDGDAVRHTGVCAA